jgi:hypothetical protein
MSFDRLGLPGVNVVTTGFTQAVEAQSNALGFEPAVVFVPHPIQNRTAGELQQIADESVEAILGRLVARS